MPVEPDDLTPYGTDPAIDRLIMREIHKITFEERMWPVMKAVARDLQDAGVDFSSALSEEHGAKE